MFIPEKFSEHDGERIRTLMRDNSFALLVSSMDGKPFVGHLPFLIRESDGRIDQIIGHMANGNPQIESVREGQDLLAVFQGPHGYVSPSWYEGPGVPTWNYATVHLYGAGEIITSSDEVHAMLENLTDHHETANGTQWTMESVSDGFVERMMTGITAFRLDVHDVQAKFKLSQNKSPRDQQHVIEQLRLRGDPASIALADLMDDD